MNIFAYFMFTKNHFYKNSGAQEMKKINALKIFSPTLDSHELNSIQKKQRSKRRKISLKIKFPVKIGKCLLKNKKQQHNCQSPFGRMAWISMMENFQVIALKKFLSFFIKT